MIIVTVPNIADTPVALPRIDVPKSTLPPPF
jgi:hypothetical protein